MAGEKLRWRKRVGSGGETRFGKVEADRRTSAECHKPNTTLKSARNFKSSTESDSSNEVGGCEIYSSENVPAAVIEAAIHPT